MRNWAILSIALSRRESTLKLVYRARFLAGTVLLASLPVAIGVSQANLPPRTSQGFAPLPETANPHPDANRALEDSMRKQNDQKRIKELNELRQKEMTSDTTKLVELANQLKSEMDKSANPDLSVESIREAEQIEKLAHTVRDKMRASVSNQ